MTSHQHFDRIFKHKEFQSNNELSRIMFVAGYEAALNEIMDRSKVSDFSARNLALLLYTESLEADVQRLKTKNAKATNNETEISL